MKTKMADWTEVCADVSWQSYGGKWAHRDPRNSLRFFFLCFTDMAEACGRDHDHDPAERYICEVDLVDLSVTPPEQIASAVSCSGPSADELEAITDINQRCLVLATALHDYGVKAPLCTEAGRCYPERVRARARRMADVYMSEPELLEIAMERTVNKIGSTARDFLCGDIDAGLRRAAEEIIAGKREPTVEERVLFRIQSVCKGQTIGGKTAETVAMSERCTEALSLVKHPED